MEGILTKEAVAEIMSTHKQLNDLLIKLVDEKGKANDNTPKADPIDTDSLKKMTDAITAELTAKGIVQPSPVKFIWGGTKEAGTNEKNVSFGKYLIMAKVNHPTLVDSYIKTVMEIQTDAQGGYTVPTEYSNAIIGSIYDPATIVGKCTPFPQGAPTKNMPKWLTGVTISWVAEDGTKTLTKPTLEQKQSVLKKIVAGPIPFTDEYLADDTANVVTGVNTLVQKAIASEIQRIILVGDVTGLADPFNGIAYAATGGNIVNQAGFGLAYPDIIDCWNNGSVLEDYRMGSMVWTMNRNAMGLCLNILDNNNKPIFMLTDTAGAINMSMIGSPVILASQILSTYGAGSDETNIIYGDFQYVLLGEKAGSAGIQVAISNSAVSGVGANNVGQNAFMQDETWYRFVMRRGVLVAIPSAYSVLKKVK